MDTTLAALGFSALALGAYVGARSLWHGRPGDRTRSFGSAAFALLVGASTYGVLSLSSSSPGGALCLPALSFAAQNSALGLVLSVAGLVMVGRVFERRPTSTPAALVALAAAAHFYPALGAAAAAGIVAACFLRPLDEVPRPDLFRFALVLTAVVALAVFAQPGGARLDPNALRAAPGPLALTLVPAAVFLSFGFTRHFPRARDAERRGGEGASGLTAHAGIPRSPRVRRILSLYGLTAISSAGSALFFDQHAASLSAVCVGILLGGALIDLAERGGGRRILAGLGALVFVIFGVLGTVHGLS